MDETPSGVAAHTHRLPPVVRVALLGLSVVALLALTGVGLLAMYVYQQQQYIEGKGEQRDRERVQLQEDIRTSICDLLDQLPAGGLLERPRVKYHCGPGLPLAALTPQERAQLPTPPPATSAPVAPSQVAPSAVPTNAPAPRMVAPTAPSAAPPASSSSTPSPTPGPLAPIVKPVCNLAGVCLQGALP